MNRTDFARRLTGAGALLMLLGLLTGFFIAAAMTGRVNADVHSVVASHLNALLGALWLIAVAWSVPMLALSDGQLRVLGVTLMGANYANWAVTAVKSLLKVSGVDLTSDPSNNAIFGLLSAFVVVPSLTAGTLWVLGLFKAQSPAR